MIITSHRITEAPAFHRFRWILRIHSSFGFVNRRILTAPFLLICQAHLMWSNGCAIPIRSHRITEAWCYRRPNFLSFRMACLLNNLRKALSCTRQSWVHKTRLANLHIIFCCSCVCCFTLPAVVYESGRLAAIQTQAVLRKCLSLCSQ